MPFEFSKITSAQRKVHSDGFAYLNLSEKMFAGLIDPILSIDIFKMSEANMPPRPMGGFSTATYLLRASPGSMESRDSRSDRRETILPGGLRWTHSGSGIIHAEHPVGGETCEGIHLSVNLPSAQKRTEPWTKYLEPAEVKEWKPNPALSGRVLIGRIAGAESKIPVPVPVSFFEFDVRTKMSVSPRVLAESGGLVYVLSGKVRVTGGDSVVVLEPAQAVGFANTEKDSELFVEALESKDGGAHFIFVSGKACQEPVVAHGPFVMNTQAEVEAAIERYQRGEMGKL